MARIDSCHSSESPGVLLSDQMAGVTKLIGGGSQKHAIQGQSGKRLSRIHGARLQV